MTQLIELPSGTLVNLANVDCIMRLDEDRATWEGRHALIFYNNQDDTEENELSKDDYDYLYGKFTLKYDPKWRVFLGL